MDIHDLVRTITEEVIRQMHPLTDKDCCMILSKREPHLTDKMQQLLGGQIDVCYFGEDVQDRTISRYILPLLTCSEMADLAAGRAHGVYITEVLNLMLNGTEVEIIDFEYKLYSETAPGPLYTLYESYLTALGNFGVKIFQEKHAESIRFWKNLVTESVINETQKKGAMQLMVPAAATITPLAAETAKNLSISIQKSL